MAGGVGEGAIPLSVGYADILHQNQGELFAQVLPIVMLGSLTAILLSGALNMLGKKYPRLTGEGRLQPGEHSEVDAGSENWSGDLDATHIAAAALFAIALYLLGLLCNKLFGLPAPVAMLFIAVLVELARAASPQLQAGSFFVFRFFQVAVTYPCMPQRSRGHGGRCYPHGSQPDATHAVRADRHAHRRRDHGDIGATSARSARLKWTSRTP